MKERKPIGKIVNRIVFSLALIVFVVAAVRLIQIGLDYYRADKEYQDIQKFVQIADTESAGDHVGSTEGETHAAFSVDFESLQKENPDCIGWIRFPNLDISYPIMQGETNDEYLRHTFYKEYATAGSIFIDMLNSPDFTDRNTFVYGHNMKNETMFGKLKGYEEEEFYQKNPGFYIYTPEGSSYYLIYSCYLAAVEGEEESFSISFADAGEYEAYIENVKSRSFYDTGVTPDATRNTVTLMTCNKAGYDYRLLIHAVQMNNEPAE